MAMVSHASPACGGRAMLRKYNSARDLHAGLSVRNRFQRKPISQQAVDAPSTTCCLKARDRFDRLLCSATKRDLLQISLLTGLVVLEAAAQRCLAAEEQQQQQQLHTQVSRVGSQQQWQSIQAAVDAAAPGATILIEQGTYAERLVIDKSLRLAPAQQGGSVVVTVDTSEPYQHCLTVQQPSSSSSSNNEEAASEVVVEVHGLTFSHYSKSVADNYAVFVQFGSLSLQQCDISSSSGVGVCVQGAELQLQDCSVHDCAAHGVAVFGALEGGLGRCQLQRCSISGNKLNGVLARDGAELDMTGCSIQGNGSYGVQLQDCAAVLSGNSFLRNRAGPAAVQLSSVEADLQQLEQSNTLDGAVALL